MECACDIPVDVDCDSYAELWEIGNVKSSEEYKCEECGDVIRSDVEHEVVRQTYDGDKSTFRTCTICLEVRNVLFTGGYYYGMIWEHFSEYLTEMGGETGLSEECLANMSPDARAKVCETIQDYWNNWCGDDDEDE